MSAPLAAAIALSDGQPSRGRTSRRSSRPQFIIARAAVPMFSPSCGSTRMIAGPPEVHDRLRSVPAISFPTGGRWLDLLEWKSVNLCPSRGAVRLIFEQDPFRKKLASNLIGVHEAALLARLRPLLNFPFDGRIKNWVQPIR